MVNANYYNYASWLGATDTGQEGEWKWIGGPEKGHEFWKGNGDSGSAVHGRYSNWYCGGHDDVIADDDWWAWKQDDQAWAYCQPDDFDNSDCMHMFGDGSW